MSEWSTRPRTMAMAGHRKATLAFCTDCDNDLKAISDLDKAMEPIVKHVWNGRTLQFPLLLDPTFTTMRRYGLRAYGTLLLIDPEGKLVKGDDNTLARILSKP